MKKTIQSLLLLASTSAFISCNDKLNIAAPYKNITVVYGLLNKADTAHYIRIQKAFMDENQSSIDMAKVADSSFYKSLVVVLKVVDNNGVVLNKDTLKKVDLTQEGYPKESGAFFNTPNIAYKSKYPLTSDFLYRLVITNTQTGNVDSSITPIIDNNDVSKFTVLEWLSGFIGAEPKPIAFPIITGSSGRLIESTFSCNIPANVGAVELIMRFRWTDSNIVTKKSVKKFADFNGFSSASGKDYVTGDKSFIFTTQNKNYYDFLNSVMGQPKDGNEYRYLDKADMFLYAAGTEYKRYKDLNSNKGGLTADEIKPQYTNIKGKDVMGLFSTRAFVEKLKIPFSNDTKDSIMSNSITKNLNIRFL
jgi:hypothetical protein